MGLQPQPQSENYLSYCELLGLNSDSGLSKIKTLKSKPCPGSQSTRGGITVATVAASTAQPAPDTRSGCLQTTSISEVLVSCSDILYIFKTDFQITNKFKLIPILMVVSWVGSSLQLTRDRFKSFKKQIKTMI